MTFTFRLTGPTETRLDAEYLEDRGPSEDASDYCCLAMRGCADLAQTKPSARTSHRFRPSARGGR